jgi:predicted TIM-barrel fold metal-dependent hydrolase
VHAHRIDVHCHYFGGAVRQWFATTGYRPTGTDTGSIKFPRWSVGGTLEFMDQHHIATQILSAPIPLVDRHGDDAFVARTAREINEDYAALIKEHPDRFGAFASLPFTTPEAALAEIAYALDELGLDGVLLMSNSGGRYLGHPFFEPILAELSRRQVPVFMHPDDCPHVDVLGFGRISAIVEYPMDTARAVNNAIFTGVFQRHPGLRLILAHGGGVLPTLGARVADLLELGRRADDAAIGPQHVADVLRDLYYETALAGSPNSLLPALHVTGHDHLLFGTDFPAAPGPAIDHNIESLMSCGELGEEQRADIERGNAARLFSRLA